MAKRMAFLWAGLVFLVQTEASRVESADQERYDAYYGNPDEAEARDQRDDEAAANAAAEENQNFDTVLAGLFNPLIRGRIFDEQFDTELPAKYRKGQWRLRLDPKFGDFKSNDYVRMPIQLRYSFSNYFEAFVESGWYFPNPFASGDRIDFYSLRLGGKYSWIDVPAKGYDLAVGFAADMPLRFPPAEISDGYARYTPYATFSYEWSKTPAVLLYWNTTLELVDRSPFKAKPLIPRPRDRTFLRPGVIYYPGGRFRYSLELEYRTNALDFRSGRTSVPAEYDRSDPAAIRAYEETHELYVIPGLVWFPTRALREGWIIPGNWDAGLRLEIPVVEETGKRFGVSLRFRWFYNYRNFVSQDLAGWNPFLDNQAEDQ